MHSAMPKQLPPLDAGLLLQMILLQRKRDKRGWHWCLEYGIGGALELVGLLPRRRFKTAAEKTRDALRAVLLETCVRCPFADCPLHARITLSAAASRPVADRL